MVFIHVAVMTVLFPLFPRADRQSGWPRMVKLAQFGVYFYVWMMHVEANTPGESVGGTGRPLVIGHRGSSGVLPEHSLPAYRLAIEQGADYIECDICVTKDLQLVCLHDSWLSVVTDSERVFVDRPKPTHYILLYDISVTDHFTFDFTLQELRQLRLRQRWSYRDQTHNGRFTIPTFDEFVELIKSANRTVGIYPELKDTDLLNSQDILRAANTTLEELVAASLTRHGYTHAHHACMMQSFSTPTLRRFASFNGVRLVRLTKGMVPTLQQLRDWAELAYGIGIAKDLLTTKDADGKITGETGVVARAHSVGLVVYVATFRNDEKLPLNFRQDPHEEFAYYIDHLHIDGLSVDFPATLSRFLACRERHGDKHAAANEGASWKQVFVVVCLALYPLYQVVLYCGVRR